jgi:hypothetical protein
MGEEQYAWKPIQRAGAPEIMVSEAGQRHVLVRLDRTPPDGWPEGFVNPPTVSSPPGMDADPELFALTVTFDCVDEAFDNCMHSIDERIAYGNQLYEQQLLPALELAERERKIAEDSRVAAQQEANKDAKNWDAGGESPDSPSVVT